MKRGGRLRAVSPKRAAQNRTYRILRAKFLTENPWCWYPGCGRRSQDLHHKAGRRGAMLLAVEHFAALCRTHHDHLTTHPAEAYRLGLSESRNGNTT